MIVKDFAIDLRVVPGVRSRIRCGALYRIHSRVGSMTGIPRDLEPYHVEFTT